MKGDLSAALALAHGPKLSGAAFQYSFYNQVADLPAAYNGLKIPYPDTPPGGPDPNNPLYTAVFDPFTAAERTATVKLFDTGFSFVDLTFASTATPTGADILFGAINHNAGSIAGWAGAPGMNIAGDVWLATTGRSAAYRDWTIAHETGHVLGLSHPAIGSAYDWTRFSSMSSQLVPELAAPSEFQLHDVAALQYLYGPASTHALGDTTYGASMFAGSDGVHDRQWSIWDAGGDHDKIDASGLAAAAFIDLRPGHFSTIGDHSNYSASSSNEGNQNVSIAFGSFIENATGTPFADKIVGNAFNNLIEGGAGNDRLYGDGTVQNPTLPVDGADYSRVTAGQVLATTIDLAAQVDSISGGEGNDYIWGGAGRNWLDGGAGSDEIRGGPLSDTIASGQGTDRLYGQGGNDQITSQGSQPWIEGGDGDDTLTGAGTGTSNVWGGAGNDRIMSGETGNLSSTDGPGDDTVFVKTSDSASLYNGAGNDTFYFARGEIEAWVDTHRIEGGDPGDRLIWNGYLLQGGNFAVIEEEPGNFYRLSAHLDNNGVIYQLNGSNSINITLPTNEKIVIAGYQTGDFGFVFDTPPSNLADAPRSNIANDGEYQNFDDLFGRSSSLANPGPYDLFI